MRHERIEELTAQVETGQYHVPGEVVAEAMLTPRQDDTDDAEGGYNDAMRLIDRLDRWTGIQPILFLLFLAAGLLATSLITCQNRAIDRQLHEEQLRTASWENAQLREGSQRND